MDVSFRVYHACHMLSDCGVPAASCADGYPELTNADRLRTDAEAKKHMRRRRKRKREKAAKAGAEDGEQAQAEQDAMITAADELEPLQVLMPAVHLPRRKA